MRISTAAELDAAQPQLRNLDLSAAASATDGRVALGTTFKSMEAHACINRA